VSELTDNSGKKRFVRHLWATASSVALLVLQGTPQAEAARGDDDPTVWIELGGQLERVDGGYQRFMPGFADQLTQAGLISPAIAQTPARYGQGAEGKFLLQTKSGWAVSVSLKYGRANGGKHTHQQDIVQTQYVLGDPNAFHLTRTASGYKASDTVGRDRESHTIIDFRAEKDVGLGLLGPHAESTVGGGLRYVELTAASSATLIGRPNYDFKDYPLFGAIFKSATHYDYFGHAENARSFRGLGPSIAWNASTMLGGDPDELSFALDWGVDASLLFGRQKVRSNHQTIGHHFEQRYYGFVYASRYATFYARSKTQDRRHSVVVPNLGGFAGLSLKLPRARVSFGYRADIFWGALDGGINTRSARDRSFYGPFATVSVGLGG
jgi:hypothetical protein